MFKKVNYVKSLVQVQRKLFNRVLLIKTNYLHIISISGSVGSFAMVYDNNFTFSFPLQVLGTFPVTISLVCLVLRYSFGLLVYSHFRGHARFVHSSYIFLPFVLICVRFITFRSVLVSWAIMLLSHFLFLLMFHCLIKGLVQNLICVSFIVLFSSPDF